MRFNSRQAALLGIPDLPLGAFEHTGDGKIRPQGGGIPIVSDVVDFVGDVVGDVVDAAVDVVNAIPIVGDVADDVLGLDPNGGGIVPVVKGIATGVVLSPITGGIGGFINSGLGLGLGTAAEAALGGATFGAATGGAQGAVYGAAGGYLGSVVSSYVNENMGTTTQTFDDGTTLTFNTNTGMPVSGIDIDGRSFSVTDGVGRYQDGSTLGGVPETNFGGNTLVGNPEPSGPPQWQQSGFSSESAYADASMKGFDNPTTYADATNTGFESAQDYYTARGNGFETATDFANAQAGGFPSGDSYYDAASRGFTNAGDYYNASGLNIDNAAQYQTLTNAGYTPGDIIRLNNQGISTAEIVANAQQGYTASDIARFANQDFNVGEYAGFTPDQIRQFSAMDYSQADIDMLRNYGLNDQQIVNMANNAIEPNTIKVWGDMGYNPEAVANDLITKGNLNDLYAAGPEASYPKTTTTTPPPPATTVISQPVAPVDTGTTDWNNVPNIDITGTQTPGTNVQVFDDGTILVSDQSFNPIGNIDNTGTITGPIDITRYDDGSFQINNTNTGASLGGMDANGQTYGTIATPSGGYQGVYPDGTTTAGTPTTNFGGGLANPSDVQNLLDYNANNEVPVIDKSTPYTPPETPAGGGSLIPGVPDIVTGLVGGAVLPGIVGPIVNPPTTPKSPYDGQTFTPTPPDERWTKSLITNDMIPEYVGRAASVPYYNTTSPVQSQYYWGVHPYVPLGGDLRQYNQIPEAPVRPWGIQQGYFEQPTAPVAPVVYGPTMNPINQG